jgi:hypothetical protein
MDLNGKGIPIPSVCVCLSKYLTLSIDQYIIHFFDNATFIFIFENHFFFQMMVWGYPGQSTQQQWNPMAGIVMSPNMKQMYRGGSIGYAGSLLQEEDQELYKVTSKQESKSVGYKGLQSTLAVTVKPAI